VFIYTGVILAKCAESGGKDKNNTSIKGIVLFTE